MLDAAFLYHPEHLLLLMQIAPSSCPLSSLSNRRLGCLEADKASTYRRLAAMRIMPQTLMNLPPINQTPSMPEGSLPDLSGQFSLGQEYGGTMPGLSAGMSQVSIYINRPLHRKDALKG